MDFQPFIWLIFFLINIGLLVLNFYQIICLSDLESDYLNPYETSSRINGLVIPEYLLHGAFCILFLLTGHWICFLLNLLPAYMNATKFMKRKHLIDVTEVFTVLSAEKKLRIVKMSFYVVLLVIVMFSVHYGILKPLSTKYLSKSLPPKDASSVFNQCYMFGSRNILYPKEQNLRGGNALASTNGLDYRMHEDHSPDRLEKCQEKDTSVQK